MSADWFYGLQKIDALKCLQNRIDNFLNYNIDSIVYIIKIIDNPSDKYTKDEKNQRYLKKN